MRRAAVSASIPPQPHRGVHYLRPSTSRTLALALVAVLLAALAAVPAVPAGAQAQESTLTMTPQVIPLGTAGELVTLEVSPGPWPDEVGLEVYDTESGTYFRDALDVRSSDGAQLSAAITLDLPQGLYDVYAQALPGGLGGEFLGSTQFYVGEAGVYTVTGKIADSSGAAVAGMCASVMTTGVDDQSFGTVQVDSTGRYTVSMLVPGSATATVQARINVSDCSERRWPDELYVAAEGQAVVTGVTLSPNTPYVQDWTVYRAATVDVTVQDAAGATLDCSRTVGPLGPGEHTVVIANCSDGGTAYADVWIGNTRNPEDAEVIRVDEGDRLSRTVTVAPAGVVTGSITEAATGQAVTSCVQVFERVDGVRTYASRKLFPATGTEYELKVGPGEPVLEFNQCEFDNWEDGSVRLQPFPYRAQFFDGAASLAGADPVSVDAGQTVTGIDAALISDDGFVDVPVDHQFRDEIAWMVGEGITTGFSNGEFRPTLPVSRQAVAVFLWRMAGEPAVSSEAGFSDVPVGHPFHDAIAWMVAEGITTGFSNGEFRPTLPVSRQAAAAFLYRFDGEPVATGVAGFSDVPVGHPFHDAIAWMVAEGITTGFPSGEFRPDRSVTRQAIAAFLYRYEA